MSSQTKKKLDSLILKYNVTVVGKGYLECICPYQNIENFIDDVSKLDIKIAGFCWWCFVPDDGSHTPCGYGGPAVKDGYYSEIIHTFKFYEFDTLDLMKAYLLHEYKNEPDYHACFHPAFYLNVPNDWDSRDI